MNYAHITVQSHNQYHNDTALMVCSVSQWLTWKQGFVKWLFTKLWVFRECGKIFIFSHGTGTVHSEKILYFSQIRNNPFRDDGFVPRQSFVDAGYINVTCHTNIHIIPKITEEKRTQFDHPQQEMDQWPRFDTVNSYCWTLHHRSPRPPRCWTV